MSLQGKRLTKTALLAAAAIALSIFESFVFGGSFFGFPGVKLGLANLAVVLALVFLDVKTALLIAIIKSLANFFVSGAITMLWYSLAGSIVSVLGMWMLYRFTKCFSLIGVSAFGGFLSNLGQLCIMILLSKTTEFFYYLPILTLSGVLSGGINGFLAILIMEKLPTALQ